MIAYYVHHHGKGHLHRATTIARELSDAVTGLSTLPRPDGWPGDWVQLEPDDRIASPVHPTAGGRLHWAPLGDAAIRRRAASLSRWIDLAAPAAFVADVSVEAALLARLHGVPVVSVALPGVRTDEAHRLGFAVSTAIIAAWPTEAVGMLRAEGADRVTAVGAISRFPVAHAAARSSRRVLVLSGAGGDAAPFPLAAARRAAPQWRWDVLSATRWMPDPWPLIRDATVVVTHGGQNALAEVAAARRPAIVVPQDRPFEEQRTTAAALERGPWPVVVGDTVPTSGWDALLERAASLDGSAWSTWNDGLGAARAARVIERTATGIR